jgi:hypothetical protein
MVQTYSGDVNELNLEGLAKFVQLFDNDPVTGRFLFEPLELREVVLGLDGEPVGFMFGPLVVPVGNTETFLAGLIGAFAIQLEREIRRELGRGEGGCGRGHFAVGFLEHLFIGE